MSPLKVLADEAPRALDPVCGMKVDPATAKHRAEHGGETFWFCSAGCKAKFEADPAKYLAGHREAMGEPMHAPHGGHGGHAGHGASRAAAAPPPPVKPGTKWICPMDPEVESDRPGACPKCGMALEPDLSAA